jgi:hypothetical protein
MAAVEPDREAALRRLRAACGFVELLEVVDHEADSDKPPSVQIRSVVASGTVG